MPLYNVELEMLVVVEAASEEQALVNAQNMIYCGSINANEYAQAVYSEEIHTRSDLRDGWDELCLPFGSSRGDKRIGEFL